MHMILFRVQGNMLQTTKKEQKFSMSVQYNAKAEEATIITG